MNKRFNSSAQGGFTLIELIVVIVILGILAATALPRFTSLGGDARLATLSAARGSLAAVASMAHGKVLVNPSVTTVAFDGINVTTANGYPTAGTPLTQAAGLNTTDFTIVQPGSAATANLPATAAKQIAIVPTSIAATPSGLNCYLTYTESTAANVPPVITLPTTATAANCQ